MPGTPRLLTLMAIGGLIGLAGCGALSSRLDGSFPSSGIVPNTTLQLTHSFGIPLEKIVFWGAYAGAAYLILDPLAPNWEIEEAPFSDNHIHFSLRMKRFYAGGTGEARQVFQRRARDLVQYGGFDGYEVKEYSEGLESSVLGSQRVATGVIRLTGKGNLQPVGQGGRDDKGGKAEGAMAPPARIMPDKATNPFS